MGPTVEAAAPVVDEIREPAAVPESTSHHTTASKRRLADELRRGFVIPRVEGRIVHSIHRYRSFDPPGTLTFRFTQVFKRFIGVSQHGNHYHVIHDCSSRKRAQIGKPTQICGCARNREATLIRLQPSWRS